MQAESFAANFSSIARRLAHKQRLVWGMQGFFSILLLVVTLAKSYLPEFAYVGVNCLCALFSLYFVYSVFSGASQHILQATELAANWTELADQFRSLAGRDDGGREEEIESALYRLEKSARELLLTGITLLG